MTEFTTVPQPVGSLQVALQHAARLLTADPRLALEQAREILKSVPHHPLAILILGTALRLLGRLDEALAILEPLSGAQPRSAHTFFELRMTYEFRLNSPADFFIRGTAGLFYQRQTDDIRAAFDLPGLNEGFPAGSFAVQSVDGQPGTVYLSQQDRTDRDYAVFADGTIDLIPNHLHLSAGIREFWV
jgi:hypothetical protein